MTTRGWPKMTRRAEFHRRLAAGFCLGLALFGTAANAFPRGSPVCDAMDPTIASNGNMGAPLNLGWSLSNFTETTYRAGCAVPMNITLSPPAGDATTFPFKGVLFYAAAADGTHLGSLSNPNSDQFQYMDSCATTKQSTITHTNGDPKFGAMTFGWTPPAQTQSCHGSITFFAVVVVSTELGFQTIKGPTLAEAGCQQVKASTDVPQSGLAGPTTVYNVALSLDVAPKTDLTVTLGGPGLSFPSPTLAFGPGKPLNQSAPFSMAPGAASVGPMTLTTSGGDAPLYSHPAPLAIPSATSAIASQSDVVAWCDSDSRQFCFTHEVVQASGQVIFTMKGKVGWGGWLALGFPSTPGKMYPADVIMGWMSSSGMPMISERGTAHGGVGPNDTATTATLLSGNVDADGNMMIRFSRALDPTAVNSAQAKLAADNQTQIIWALQTEKATIPPGAGLGDDPNFTYHSARGSGSVNLGSQSGLTNASGTGGDVFPSQFIAPLVYIALLVLGAAILLPMRKTSAAHALRFRHLGPYLYPSWFHTLTIDSLRQGLLLSLGELIYAALFLLMLSMVALFGYRNAVTNGRDSPRVSVTAYLAETNLFFVLFPVQYYLAPLMYLFRIPRIRAIAWHRIIGRLALFFVFLHGVFALVDFGSANIILTRPTDFGAGNLFGLLAFVCLATMALLSIQWVRTHYYEVFKWSHILLMVLGLAFAIAHANSLGFFLIVPLGLYVVDSLVKVYHRAKATHEITQIEELVGGVVRVTVSTYTDVPVLPGQYVKMCIPSISKVEWHPFTVAYTNPKANTLTFLVKATGSDLPAGLDGGTTFSTWTRKLQALARQVNGPKSAGSTPQSSPPTITLPARSSIHGFLRIPVHLSDPLGCVSFDLQSQKILVLVGGGVGITPIASTLDHISQHYGEAEYKRNSSAGRPNQYTYERLERVIVIWTAKDEAELKVWLQGLKIANSKILDIVEVRLHATNGAPVAPSTMFAEPLDGPGSPSGPPLLPPSLPVFRGRPNLSHVMASISDGLSDHAMRRDVGVFVCGPEGLIMDTVNAAREQSFKTHVESFS